MPDQAIAEGVVPTNSTVSVVDDDASVRQALKRLLKSAGFHAEVFASAEEFLGSGRLAETACLVLDVRMPGLSGLELQDQLIATGCSVPIIFITAHGDEDARTRALERGAIDFLQKPFSDEALLNALARIGAPPSR
jgi:FixJ family two-component response regulator